MAILTVNLFNQYSDNYFLSNSTPNNILNAGVRKVLPNIINNVETSLNAMLNGRLYQTFNPNGQITFKDATQQTTLYSVLTECVLYRIQTGEYINLHNQYTGNVNGTNNFSTDNSNVIGLRNDIRDKLILLGLYQSGSFTQATLPTIPNNSNNNVLTQEMLFKILQGLQHANIDFKGTISLPSNTTIGQASNICQLLREFEQILSNYTSTNGSPTVIPNLSTQTLSIFQYYPINLQVDFNTSQVIATSCTSKLTMNSTITTSTSTTLTLTLTFSSANGINGLHLEPTFTGNGWLANASSCILNTDEVSGTNWNVTTSYPSWSYTFTAPNPMISFTITNPTPNTTYILSLQGFVVLLEDISLND